MVPRFLPYWMGNLKGDDDSKGGPIVVGVLVHAYLLISAKVSFSGVWIYIKERWRHLRDPYEICSSLK